MTTWLQSVKRDGKYVARMDLDVDCKVAERELSPTLSTDWHHSKGKETPRDTEETEREQHTELAVVSSGIAEPSHRWPGLNSFFILHSSFFSARNCKSRLKLGYY